jgi:integrase
MIVMNDDGMHNLLSSKFKIGADASAAAGPVGRHAGADTDWKMKAQVLTYSRSRGLFAGVDLNGAALTQDKDETRILYGKFFPFDQILEGKAPRTIRLRLFGKAVCARRLSVDQLSQLIYGELKQREQVMVLLDFGTGLRRGELSGVRWEDVCFDDKVLIPKRSIVKQRIGKVKTEASKKSIPLDDVLIELLAWRRETPYAQDNDYVFASTKMRGKQPYWMSRIMQHQIKPVAAKRGIEIKGWHTLRHSYTTLLRQNNNNPKVVQGLLRHASYSTTMNVYDEAMSEGKRNAHRGVIQQVNRSVTRSVAKPTTSQVVDEVGVPDGI